VTALWTPIRLIPKNLVTAREIIIDTGFTDDTDYTLSRLAAKEIQILEMEADIAPLPRLHRIETHRA